MERGKYGKTVTKYGKVNYITPSLAKRKEKDGQGSKKKNPKG